MPGRQAHGRSLLASKPTPKNIKKSSAKTRARALDAFHIAQEQFPTKEKRTPRFRDIEGAEAGKKHRREEDDDEEGDDDDEDDEDDQPRRKKAKAASRGGDDDEYGSDSEGNEWHYGVDEDEDSDIDSDEAFGDSDGEQFEGYAFKGSASNNKKGKKKQSQDDSDDNPFDDSDFEAGDDGEDLGDEAIDLVQALDMASDESEEGEEGASDESGSEEDDEEEAASSDEDEDDDEADPSKLDALKGYMNKYAGREEEEEPATSTKPKISFSDLGLSTVKDPRMRKIMKLMTKEEKAERPEAAKKLAIPLAKRQQDKLTREAAYDKTNETLERWTETVKANRRAEHLVFPLPENAQNAGLNHDELQPITAKNTTSELESTILSIMEKSGLALTKQEANQKAADEKTAAETEGLSKEELKELLGEKRRQRELASREAKRAARIKKIKSKAYHRVHRKQKERDDRKLHEAMAEAGEVDSEAEREAADRARALERVGARHRESRWAKAGSANKRAVWDDDYRAGLHDMARKDEELRKRIAGRAGGEADSEDDYSDSEEDEDGKGGSRRLLARLEKLEKEGDESDDEPRSKLMDMKFMRRAEESQKKANDELIAKIRRDLDSDAGSGDDDADAPTEVGRRRFGGETSAMAPPALQAAQERKQRKKKEEAGDDSWEGLNDSAAVVSGTSITAAPAATGNAWSSGEPRRKGRKAPGTAIDTIDTADIISASKPKPKAKASKTKTAAAADTSSSESDSDSDSDVHLPLAVRDIAQLDKAFAGDDVVAEFEREKAADQEDQDDKVIDNTLPGWGSWVGDGITARQQARHKGRFLTKVEGTKKKDRRDAKLDKVIINEKRLKNNDKYLATQLPHPFESRAQYERSLRLPMGPEWMTKQSFQEAVKPRLLMKQGIITPMSRPSQ
ncbi:Utp14 protein-domain-containing protein [Plectosphaerella cucumerina]|uniref:Utp14 protein-domain-containing protein n=1 Tax=Plectosphaerella cucumerina TaxID=40658 RepID=A0A8K0X6I8_9PEZI|nr:Utp14 protein-domain-containing protein [Plectosphaerella cucumerina]